MEAKRACSSICSRNDSIEHQLLPLVMPVRRLSRLNIRQIMHELCACKQMNNKSLK
jgi:hypothetical protein